MEVETTFQKLINLEIQIQSSIVELGESLTLSTKEASELSNKALHNLSQLYSHIKVSFSFLIFYFENQTFQE
jgi:hypothetical protein